MYSGAEMADVGAGAPGTSALAFVDCVGPHASPALVSQAALTGLRSVASVLPSLLSRVFILESDLGSAAADVDLSVCCGAEDQGLDILAGRRGGLGLPPSLASEPGWLAAGRLARGCLGDRGPDVHSAWLEFDAGSSVPSLFFGASPRGDSGFRALLAVLECTLPGPLPPGAGATLLRCFQALPAGAEVYQMGAMTGRAVVDARICVRGIRAQDAAGYLGRVGWRGPGAALTTLLARLAPETLALHLSVSLEDGALSPRVGVELAGGIELAGGRPPLDALAADALCTPAKLAAVRAWPGASDARSEERWPPMLARAEAALGGRWRSGLLRRLSHVKITLAPGEAPRAKAYLWFAYFVSPARGHAAKMRVSRDEEYVR